MLAKINKSESLNENIDEPGSLWSGLRAGNPDSLSKLFCISYPWLYNYGYKIIPREAFIKDAIQELFLNLWRKREEISDALSVKAYLFTSLRRIIFRRLKKQKNRTERNHDYKENFFEEIYNVEEVMIHFEIEQQKKEQLAYALKSLSKRQKEAIYLKFFNGLSNKDIAEVMDINKQSVYNHVSKAIQKMQKYVVA